MKISLVLIITVLSLCLISCSDTGGNGGAKTDSIKFEKLDTVISKEPNGTVEKDPFAVGSTLSSQIVKEHLLKQINQKQLKKGKLLSILGTMTNMPNLDYKNRVILASEDNVVLDRTNIESSGKFRFEKLPAGLYNVLIEKPIDNLALSIETNVIDESSLPTQVEGVEPTNINDVPGKAFINKHKFVTLPSQKAALLKGGLSGTITAPVNSQIKDIEILLLDESGKIVQKTISDKNGKFKFDKLPQGALTIVLNSSIPNLNAKIEDLADSSESIALELDNDFKIETNKTAPVAWVQKNQVKVIDKNLFRDDFADLSGKIVGAKSAVSVVLLDENNKVIRVQSANPNFKFDKLPYGDYKLVVPNKTPDIKADVSLVVDDSDLPGNMPTYNFELNTVVPKAIAETNSLGNITVGNVNTIHGFFHEILGKQKKAIINEEIFILNKENRIVAKTKSDNQGKFTISQLKNGEYKLVGKKSFSKIAYDLGLNYKEGELDLGEH